MRCERDYTSTLQCILPSWISQYSERNLEGIAGSSSVVTLIESCSTPLKGGLLYYGSSGSTYTSAITGQTTIRDVTAT